jgi:hypothetical protein
LGWFAAVLAVGFFEVLGWYGDPPRSAGRLANTDITQWTFEVRHSILRFVWVVGFGDVVVDGTFDSCLSTDAARPLPHFFITDIILHRLLALILWLRRKHVFVLQTQALNHGDDITVLRVEFLDLIFVALIPHHTDFVASGQLVFVFFELMRLSGTSSEAE